MSRIEELPDDFDDTLHLNDYSNEPFLDGSSRSLHRKNATTKSKRDLEPQQDSPTEPQIPPTSMDIATMLDKTPLFMNSLENAADDDGDNVQLDALRALQYEGTKAEIAQGFKDRGNESVAEKAWSDAREFYSKGLAVLAAKDKQWEEAQDLVVEIQRQKLLEETLRANRAMVQLELKNYRSTIFDCIAALKLNPNNAKALYRCAAALLALDRHDEAVTVCLRGLDVDKQNLALERLLEKARAAKQIFVTRNATRQAERQRKEQEQLTLSGALKARGIKLRNTKKSPDLEDAIIHLEPDTLNPKSELVFPVVLLYPLHEQSDFIKRFRETESIMDHLEYIFPTPWDREQLYSPATVDCYMDTITGGLVKAGKKLSMLKLVSSGKTEIVDGLINIHVVPKQMAEKWIAQVRTAKAF